MTPQETRALYSMVTCATRDTTVQRGQLIWYTVPGEHIIQTEEGHRWPTACPVILGLTVMQRHFPPSQVSLCCLLLSDVILTK